jgi:hypothetical protein
MNDHGVLVVHESDWSRIVGRYDTNVEHVEDHAHDPPSDLPPLDCSTKLRTVVLAQRMPALKSSTFRHGLHPYLPSLVPQWLWWFACLCAAPPHSRAL